MSNKSNSSSLGPWLIGDETGDGCLGNDNLVRCSMLILALLAALCGLVTNTINLIVFYLQGFRDSVQVSLAALAISDIFTDVAMAIFSFTVLDTQLCLYLYLPASLRFSSSWLAYALSLNSSCVAVFIAVERCLCTTMPLKVKDVITPNRSFLIVFTIGVVSLAAVSPSLSEIDSGYLQSGISQGNSSSADSQVGTPVGIAVSNAIVFNTQSVALVCLLVSTIILVVVLRRRTRWRGTFSATTSSDAMKTARRKDERVHVMVVVVSAILLTCYIPGQLLTLVSLVDEDFSNSGRHQYLYNGTWSVSYFLYSLNASVNLVVYYNMSTRFRETLDRLMTFK